MPNPNAIKVKKWFQKKKQDPDFYEEYKRKQKLYYHRRKALQLKDKEKSTTSTDKEKSTTSTEIANCQICNKEFVKNKSNQVHCSSKCREKKKNIKIQNDPVLKQAKYLIKKKWVSRNKEKIKIYKKNFNEKLKLDPVKHQKQLEAVRKWKLENKQRALEQNRKSRKKMFSKWKKQKKLIDPSYHISETIRSYLSRSIKGKILKKKKTEEIVGISFNKLVAYLESKFEPGMSMSNYGKWHIDHIKPVTKFDLTKPGELEKCFHYTNLQPMWARDNIIKSNKYDPNN
jgi:hypothetical protein